MPDPFPRRPMPTAARPAAESVTMSGEAYDCLDCLTGELGDYLHEVAKAFAVRRAAGAGGRVEIEIEDVRAAGRFLARAAREASHGGHAPPHVTAELLAALDDSDSCLND